MTTKEYLSQVKKLDKIIKNRIRELDELRLAVSGLTSVQLTKDVVVTSKRKDRMESLVVKMVDEENLINEYIDKKYEIIEQLERLDVKDYEILYMRYVNGYSFEYMLDKINEERICSERQMYRKYKTAMQHFENRYGRKYL